MEEDLAVCPSCALLNLSMQEKGFRCIFLIIFHQLLYTLFFGSSRRQTGQFQCSNSCNQDRVRWGTEAPYSFPDKAFVYDKRGFLFVCDWGITSNSVWIVGSAMVFSSVMGVCLATWGVTWQKACCFTNLERKARSFLTVLWDLHCVSTHVQWEDWLLQSKCFRAGRSEWRENRLPVGAEKGSAVSIH